MLIFSEDHLNSCGWTWILFACFLVLFTRLIYNWKLSSTQCEINGEHSKEFSANTTSNGVCTSLSCVRCSTSVFSTDNLLEKWSAIQKTLLPSEDVILRVTKGILGNGGHTTENSKQEPTVFFLEELPSKAWYTADDFPREISILERDAAFEIFLSEFLEIYRDFDVGWVSNSVASGGWYLFYLWNQGVRMEDNCKKCPRTMKLIEKLPLLLSDCAFGNVMFSVLLPKTIIDRHCGPSNVRIRCHIPLEAPGGYFISVAGEERPWEENKVLIFDDSFYHNVYHYGCGIKPRVVLMVDFWHPCLTFHEKEIIKSLFSIKH